MPKIHSLKISHYRGIKLFEQIFPDKNLIVLIGRGDSGKTTLLKAIQSVLSPAWNLSFSDYDFYNGDTSEPINIECTLTDIPPTLKSESKFGLYLQLLKSDGSIPNSIMNEEDSDEPVLTIRLTVNDDLEPHWVVTSHRKDQEEMEISANDRAKLNMFMVADYVDNHFTYSKFSPLYALLKQQLDDKSQIDKKLTDLTRTAYEVISKSGHFDEFDYMLNDLKSVAERLGIEIDDLRANIEYQDKTFTESNISLQSKKIPYRLHGKGSKRLLSLALQTKLAKDGGITLFDEVEQGLEPDRIVNLIRLIKEQTSLQVFLTTHSSYALIEANWDNVFLLKEGANKLIPFTENDQGILRSHPECFFSKKIICCEGKTEQGVLRAIDACMIDKGKRGFASYGVVVANSGGGDKFYTEALSFKNKGYDVAILADNDVQELEKKVNYIRQEDIPIFVCDEGNSIEQQVFKNLPWTNVTELLNIINNERPNLDIFHQIGVSNINEIKDLTKEDQEKRRIDFGDKSKRNAWFKNFDGGETIGRVIYNSILNGTLNENATLYKNFSSLMEWIRK